MLKWDGGGMNRVEEHKRNKHIQERIDSTDEELDIIHDIGYTDASDSEDWLPESDWS